MGGEGSEKPIHCTASSLCKENVHRALEKLKEGCWTGVRKMKKVRAVFMGQASKLDPVGLY